MYVSYNISLKIRQVQTGRSTRDKGWTENGYAGGFKGKDINYFWVSKNTATIAAKL